MGSAVRTKFCKVYAPGTAGGLPALGASLLLALLGWSCALGAATEADAEFETLAAAFVDDLPALSPVSATGLGDHRYDDRLDQVDAAARARTTEFYERYGEALLEIDFAALSPANRIDAELLAHEMAANLWSYRELQEWAWNPLLYTGIAGSAIYSLLARDFAPLEERLAHAAARLEAMPRYFAQVRGALQPSRVPKVHAETALRQHPGFMAIVDDMLVPAMSALPDAERERLLAAIEVARAAAAEHGEWLEETLLPNAAGEFRLGAERFDRKLAFTLNTPLSRREIRDRAELEYQQVRDEMYQVAKEVYKERYPYTRFPDRPSAEYRQAIVRAALEVAYAKKPARDEIVEVASRYLEQTTAFVREKDLVRVPDDPIEIILMPEFQRGVAIAYLDAPGPLDKGRKTFYAVAPIPEDWTEEQVDSFLREYNLLSIQDLTIHEAMPGHHLQLAHANDYPSVLRAVLASGPFIEGWAVYAERMMIEQGYLGGDPLMRLINLKWYLRAVINAIIDQAIHVEGMTRDEAMKLMVEGGFQEEREAAGKWVRAQLTSAQLSTYFVGYQEHADLRREYEAREGDAFSLRGYHDKILSYGSPPVRYVRALMLGEPVSAAGAR